MANKNNVIDAMIERRSVKKYKPDMVSMDLINEVVKAGLYAASGMNKQSPIIIAVTDKALRDKLSALNAKIGGWKPDFDPFYNAPVVLIVLADKNIATHVYDGSLVIGNMMLAAHSLGLGSCWIHRAKEEFETPEGKELLKSLGIEGEYEGIGHCVIGYADVENENAKPLERKDNRVFYVK